MAKVIVHSSHTEIFLAKEELKLCKIGQGADTCILLTASPNGMECHALNRMSLMPLIERARRGETVARREGCEEAESLSIHGLPMYDEVEIKLLKSNPHDTQ